MIPSHAWRVRQGQAASHDPAAGDLDQAAAVVLDCSPAGRRIGCSQCGNISHLPIDDSQAIEMTSVLGPQGRNERRPPARCKTVMRIERGQAREESIHDPELTANPCAFMRLDVAGEVARPRQEAGIMKPGRRKFRGNVGSVPQEPDFLPRTNGNRSRLDGDSHRPLELMERKHQPALPRRHNNEMAGLVRGDKDRQPQLLQQRLKVFRMRTSDVAKFLRALGFVCDHNYSSSQLTQMPAALAANRA